MMDMLSIEFVYNNKNFFALVRCKRMEPAVEYHVTIMNGELESMFYGHHVFVEKPAGVEPKTSCKDKTILSLRDAVCRALCQHLESAHQLVAH